VTGIRRNRKNDLLPLLDKVLLRKRSIIETLFAKLKSSMGLEHTRHRWPINALVHILILPGGNHPGTTQGQYRQLPLPHYPKHTLTLSSIGVTRTASSAGTRSSATSTGPALQHSPDVAHL
ncbi:MAG: hypothetical protein F4Y87_03400, partial [Synechococcus sp. SB0665_bin_28]|nr:hypothetical protein [Synechococcus sp. SB0665_bin_28]